MHKTFFCLLRTNKLRTLKKNAELKEWEFLFAFMWYFNIFIFYLKTNFRAGGFFMSIWCFWGVCMSPDEDEWLSVGTSQQTSRTFVGVKCGCFTLFRNNSKLLPMTLATLYCRFWCLQAPFSWWPRNVYGTIERCRAFFWTLSMKQILKEIKSRDFYHNVNKSFRSSFP
jgi:hypothetical protein